MRESLPIEVEGGDGDGIRVLRRAGAELDHVGIAVRSLERACAVYTEMGLDVGCVEEVAGEHVRVAMVARGASRIELIEPTDEHSTVARFLARRGEGLHHIGLRVRDVEAALEGAKGRGMRLVSDRMEVGAGGHRYFFVHPESTGGVLVEVTEAEPGGGDAGT